MRYSLILVVILSTSAVVFADTISVPGDYPTIQAGIDAAAPGDTVMVADGVYTRYGNRNIEFNGKAVLLRSANGPENCVIDCEMGGIGFYFMSGEGPATEVRGFTIRNGCDGYYFGAIAIESSSPTIADNIITGNIAYSSG